MTTHPNLIEREHFGEYEGTPVERFVLLNGHGARVAILSFGAAIQEIWVPGRDGELANVVLGFEGLEGYTGRHPHFGTVLGRLANRL
ncbi:MAG TPA: hypothetical protein VEW66_00420, partial [Thermomicrobiales bacterium]|nr:hypothetical protein [Thermomicrobiales bacterium]